MKSLENMHYQIAVIGGGAAGLMAACAAAEAGNQVIIFDSCDKPGKKIYATGNGKCNLTNLNMDDTCFHTGSDESVTARFAVFNSDDLMRFFKDAGVLLHDRNGYVYPRTDQAAIIVEALLKRLSKLNVKILCGHRVKKLSYRNKSYSLEGSAKDNDFICKADRVILATGGMCQKAFGCRGDGYDLAGSFGHGMLPAVPALTQLFSSNSRLKVCAGVRCRGKVRLFVDGIEKGAAEGELQMTEKGISGIPVFQISHYASRAFYNCSENKEEAQVKAIIDFLPELSDREWYKEIEKRLTEADLNAPVSDLFMGLVHPAIASFIIRSSMFEGKELADEKKIKKIQASDPLYLKYLLKRLRECEINIIAADGFEKAQVTSGGIPLKEINRKMESVFSKGLYLAGELIDVDGICGGYNLTWAMCTGYIAGQNAAASFS